MSEELSRTIRNLSKEERSIYLCIYEAGADGILEKQIIALSSLDRKTVDRFSKSLKKKKMVKCEKSMSHGHKYLWMLAEIEQERDITEKFDLAGIQLVCDKVELQVRKRGQVSKGEIDVYIKQLGILQLSDKDIN